MSYDRTLNTGFGINLPDVSMFNPNPEDEGWFDESEILEEILEDYPLLELEGAGDYRYDEIIPIIVISESLVSTWDENFNRANDDGTTIFKALGSDEKDIDPEALAQLKDFISKYDLDRIPSQLSWSNIA